MIEKLKKQIDFKLISILSGLYAFFVIIYASKLSFLRLKYPKRIEETSWSKFFLNHFIDWVVVTIFIVFMVSTTKFLINKKTKLIYIGLIHLFFSFFLGVFTLGITWVIENLTDSQMAANFSFNDYLTAFISLIDLNFLIYFSLVTIIYMYYYFLKNQEIQIQAAKLREQLSDSKLKFLQAQIHPHFLFNTLNSIYSLMDINIEKSKKIVVDLSDILRHVLDKKDENLIELQEELLILKKYIDINKMRFSDQLSFNIDIEEGLENVLIPNMIIQPIVENSIKHGFDKDIISLKIFIRIHRKHDKLIIIIKNNGEKLNKDVTTLFKKGTGLTNIKERLNTLYANNYILKIYNRSDKVVTKLSFPIQLSISEITHNY
ncbi:histidine kinase [Gaetbulibacter sp. M235]|uniref:sensor histidine kinase n=1 Tax=Gaetbulibacter sp. M235 TaxID=3126510 RepID=UPI00374E8CD5